MRQPKAKAAANESSAEAGQAPIDLRQPHGSVAPGDPRGLFLGDYMGLETISGNNVINFFRSTVPEGADVHAIRANHP